MGREPRAQDAGAQRVRQDHPRDRGCVHEDPRVIPDLVARPQARDSQPHEEEAGLRLSGPLLFHPATPPTEQASRRPAHRRCARFWPPRAERKPPPPFLPPPPPSSLPFPVQESPRR